MSSSLFTLSTPFLIPQTSVISPLSLLLSKLISPSLFSLSRYGSCSIPLVIYVAFLRTFSNSTTSFPWCGDQNCTHHSRCECTMGLYTNIVMFSAVEPCLKMYVMLAIHLSCGTEAICHDRLHTVAKSSAISHLSFSRILGWVNNIICSQKLATV